MARYIGPNCRLCRRVGEKLFLKGERCFTPRCAVERRRQPPGAHAPRRRRASDWANQLREKQKARFMFGVLERQFRRYFEEARRRPGITGQFLLELLERRLDNVVFRLNMADSRKQARQWVLHGHITINGRKVNIPSYRVRMGDVIAWKEASTRKALYKEVVQMATKRPPPEWLSLDTEHMVGKVLHIPEPQDMEGAIDTKLIVEFYSR